MIRWTSSEWLALAAEYQRQRGDPLARINKAQNVVFEPGSLRRRALYQKQQFWEPLRKALKELAAAQQAASPEAQAVEEIIQQEAILQGARAEFASEPDSLDSLVKRVVTAITQEVTGAVALAVIEEVKRVIAIEVPKAIQTSAALWFTNTDLGVEPAPPQEINITVADPIPEGATRVTVPTKDRKPRITVMGLIGQQEQDVLHAWGQTIDFQFVKAGPNMGPVALDKSRTADVVVNMTRFTHHTAEQYVKQIEAPLVRINGSVSSLKKWIADWINGRSAIVG